MAKVLETEAELRAAAMNLLARREYSRAELWRKLSVRAEDTALLEATLDGLESDGYQSDERFAEVFTRSRLESGYGAMRVRQELRRKGLDSDLIEQALEAAEVDTDDQALTCCRRRFGDTPPDNPKEYARRMRFLVNRGFDFGVAKKAINTPVDE
ncbi:regulatory protein RecX [Marinobacterium sp. AK62]|uniref:Regulatory protein RecX n=1 Tax=Marinobacterium alkalitolerans TaxID=1542925 RepID=A0ABS3ZEM8_9GAMM|nr:regulatory protein RecX [Marinobacterium alkalitolerans]MBP0050151.1 regulatory protein RecX [Marinobacterium alkalitolerans]